MNGPSTPEHGTDEILFIALVLMVGAATALGWGGAELGAFFSHARFVHLPASDGLAFWFKVRHFTHDPRLTWPAPASASLATADLYWFSTVLVGLVLLGAGLGIWKLFHLHPEGLDRRRRLGVRTQGRLANRADLAPLLISRPEPGRLVLGRFGRALVATEDPRRRGRGLNAALAPVALVGPTRSGKTTTAMAGIQRWDGPAVLVSVKADLLAETEEARSRLGPVQVFDPAGVTGRPSAVWNPLSTAVTISGALRLAAALREAAPRSAGVEANEFFYRAAEGLLAALLLLAANTDKAFSDVVRWVISTDVPTEMAPGVVAPLMRALKADPDPARQAAGVFVADALEGLWRNDHRTISSVYATARTLIWAFVDPAVAAATGTDGDLIDPAIFLSGTGTLYVCLPLTDEGRLRPVLGGALAAVVAAVYDHHMAGRDLSRRLLLVIDEAASIRPDQLASWAATLAGVGVQLVTIWQSVAQIAAAYGPEHQAILTNHPTKLFYSGMSDTAGLDYVSGLAGEEHLPARLSRPGRPGYWDEDPVATLPLAAPAVLRQMKRGEALLLHGNLPPAHIRPLPWRRRRGSVSGARWRGLSGLGASRVAASLRCAWRLRSGSRSDFGRPLTRRSR